MKIINNTSFRLVAFSWKKPDGYSSDVVIPPAGSAYVNEGPFFNDYRVRSDCVVHLDDEVTFQETPSDENCLQITRGSFVILKQNQTDNEGIVVHHIAAPFIKFDFWGLK